MNISETSGPIAIKFYLKHRWGGGKAAIGFGADQIRTLVSMTTDISDMVIITGENGVIAFSRLFLIGSFSYLPVTMTGNNDMHKSLDEFEIWPNSTLDYGVSCP